MCPRLHEGVHFLDVDMGHHRVLRDLKFMLRLIQHMGGPTSSCCCSAYTTSSPKKLLLHHQVLSGFQLSRG